MSELRSGWELERIWRREDSLCNYEGAVGRSALAHFSGRRLMRAMGMSGGSGTEASGGKRLKSFFKLRGKTSDNKESLKELIVTLCQRESN